MARKTSSKKIIAAAAPLLLTYQPAQAIMLPEAPVAHIAAAMNEKELQETFMNTALALTASLNTTQDLDAALDSLELEPTTEEIADREDRAERSFREVMAAYDETAVQAMTTQITAAIDGRVVFEHDKHGVGHNIQKTLNKVRKALMWKETSRVMLAANVDPSFINRTLHDGSRYNVYAVDKVADAVKGIAEGVISNAINRACMVSLFQIRKAGLPFTGEVAKACASDKHHIDLSIRKHLMRHTVSASTAPTQASSTMQALETLGIVKREGSSRNPTFTLTDAPITKRLEEVLFPIAA